MADIPVPYSRRQLARGGGGGGGGGGAGVVAQPRIPDVSGMYRPLAGIGEEASEAAAHMAQVAAQRQRAKDVAQLTAAESDFSVELGRARDALQFDASVNPFDYGEKLTGARNALLEQRRQALPGRLHGAFDAKVKSGTEAMLINFNHLGMEKGVKQALTSLDTYEKDMASQLMVERNPAQVDAHLGRLREKWGEFVESGLMSKEDALARSQTFQRDMLENMVAMRVEEDPKRELQALQGGEYPMLAPESRLKLIDKAQGARREAAEWQDSEDRRAERRVAEQQAMTSSQLRDRVYAMGGGPASIKLISESRANRQISEGDHSTLMQFAITLQNHRASQAALAASRAAAEASRQEIAQRRADENATGLLIARRLDGRPGPDGQIVTSSTIMDMATSGKINGKVAGEVAMKVDTHERILKDNATTETRQAFQNALQVAESIFEQAGMNPTKVQGVQQAWSGFREELTSKVFRDGQDPFRTSDEILNKYVAQASSALSKRQEVIINTLPYQYRPTPAEGTEPAKQKLKQDYDARISNMSQGDFKMHLRRLKELEDYPDFREAATKRRTAAQPAEETPAPAPTAPQGSRTPDIDAMRRLLQGLRNPLKAPPIPEVAP
jgi:hypothetical protein